MQASHDAMVDAQACAYSRDSGAPASIDRIVSSSVVLKMKYELINFSRRHALQSLAALPVVAGINACGGGSSNSPPMVAPTPPPTRSWKLGFSPNPARPTAQSVLQGIDMWSLRAELAIIHEEMPWTKLLGGMTPDAIINADKVNLVNYMRGKGMQLMYMGDLNDGLSRKDEAPQLRALGRSITEPTVQKLYRDYMVAVARKLNPQFIGLAAETNLIRAAAPTLYPAVVRTANDAANDIRAAGGAMPLMISVQVETAWGVLGGSGAYVGIDIDRIDFPFVQIMGLSSYPYFGFTQPEDIPANYYSRLLPNRGFPGMVTEGGWLSGSAGTITSSLDKQARYFARHAQLLDAIDARALLQLNFADPDLSTFPQPIPANLPLFATIGLTDSDLNAKPALAAWDALYARRLV
jgi:hypothetical protein